MADRLFNINILAGLHRPDPTQRVPVIGRRRTDCIDRIVIESPPHVGHKRWPLALLFGDHITFAVSGRVIDIDDIQNFGSGIFHPSVNVAATASSGADNCDTNLVVGRDTSRSTRGQHNASSQEG